VVAHAAAGRGDARGHPRRVQDLQCRWPAVARRPHAQRGPHHGARHVHPRTGADATLRAAYVGTGAGPPSFRH